MVDEQSLFVGMSVLLTHMEQGHSSLQPLVVSVVADLLDKSSIAKTFLLGWRSAQTALNAVQSLLHLWREYASEWQVCTNGVLTSVHKPLAGTGKRNLWIPKHEVQTSTWKILSLLCRCMPRLPPLK